MIPTISVRTESCTTQQELSLKRVLAPTCETFKIALSSYTYPLQAHAHTHTPHTHIKPLFHNVSSQGGEFWLGCIQSCHPRDPREIWIWKDTTLPIWSACITGQQGLVLRCAFQRPDRVDRQEGRVSRAAAAAEGREGASWKLNVQQQGSLIKELRQRAYSHTHTPLAKMVITQPAEYAEEMCFFICNQEYHQLV